MGILANIVVHLNGEHGMKKIFGRQLTFRSVGLLLMSSTVFAYIITVIWVALLERESISLTLFAFQIGFTFAIPPVLILLLSWKFPLVGSVLGILLFGLLFFSVCYDVLNGYWDASAAWIVMALSGLYLIGAFFVFIGSIGKYLHKNKAMPKAIS